MEKRDKNTGIRTTEQSIQQSLETPSQFMNVAEGEGEWAKKPDHKHLMTHLQYVILKRVDSIMFDFSCALDYSPLVFSTRPISFARLPFALATNLYCVSDIYFLSIAPTGCKQQMVRMSAIVEQFRFPLSIHSRKQRNSTSCVVAAAASIAVW